MIKINSYSRISAVQYALTYALSPNPEYKYMPASDPIGNDCTNFVSQCIHAGGAPMSKNSIPWWYENGKYSFSWTVANSFYLCLKERARLNTTGLKGIEVYDLAMLELGDLIFYEDSSGKIYHSAIVTSFYFGVPLISQHSIDARNIYYLKAKAVKMYFMKIYI